ncbi:PREDICTED: uncharacterized protein LOC106146371 [Chinchilla lanigera]|uniref:uncharacterized protein LOC106146371 n=1 Tax=Chinchilla lanigera TaxID=34839 RepID=UPI000695C51E|nr:PREDICTED: uncharacterized protein LOC106146371 [Chinchilla lanigera]
MGCQPGGRLEDAGAQAPRKEPVPGETPTCSKGLRCLSTATYLLVPKVAHDGRQAMGTGSCCFCGVAGRSSGPQARVNSEVPKQICGNLCLCQMQSSLRTVALAILWDPARLSPVCDHAWRYLHHLVAGALGPGLQCGSGCLPSTNTSCTLSPLCPASRSGLTRPCSPAPGSSTQGPVPSPRPTQGLGQARAQPRRLSISSPSAPKAQHFLSLCPEGSASPLPLADLLLLHPYTPFPDLFL